MPTIMDELNKAGLGWRLYTAAPGNGYLWAICPTFAKCLYTGYHRQQVPTAQVLSDAKEGKLPNFSVVPADGAGLPAQRGVDAAGDNWIGQVVSAIEHGPDWRSTAIFITYDDCGCFYDHVAPPPGSGSGRRWSSSARSAGAATVDSNQASIRLDAGVHGAQLRPAVPERKRRQRL